MKFFNELNLPNVSIIVDKMKELLDPMSLKYPTFAELDQKRFLEIPELWDSLQCIGLSKKDLRNLAVVTVCYNNNMEPHVDYERHNTPSLALNWPVLNCEKSQTNFYIEKTHTEIILKYATPDIVYLGTNPDNLTLKDTLVYDRQPVLMRVDCWHNVENNDPENKPRVVISMRFKDEAEERLKQLLQ